MTQPFLLTAIPQLPSTRRTRPRLPGPACNALWEPAPLFLTAHHPQTLPAPQIAFYVLGTLRVWDSQTCLAAPTWRPLHMLFLAAGPSSTEPLQLRPSSDSTSSGPAQFKLPQLSLILTPAPPSHIHELKLSSCYSEKKKKPR